MFNKLVFGIRHHRCDSCTLTSTKLLFATCENSFVSLELVKPCLNSDLCTFVHHSLLASGRNKPVNWELLTCSWNSAEIQKYMLKCPTRFLKVYSSISPNSSWVSSLWQTIKPDAEFCGACLREDSISGSRLQLFDLFSQETGKKEKKMKN